MILLQNITVQNETLILHLMIGYWIKIKILVIEFILELDKDMDNLLGFILIIVAIR